MQLNIKDIADKADMIINGYAFTKDGDYIRVLNLDHLNHAAVILKDDIETQIALDYYKNNKQFMEEYDA